MRVAVLMVGAGLLFGGGLMLLLRACGVSDLTAGIWGGSVASTAGNAVMRIMEERARERREVS